MKDQVLIEKLKKIATEYKTLYVMGCFGAPMNAKNKQRYCTNHQYNKAADRQAMIKAATDDTFGFDCVCLIKGVLWGWSGDKTKTYGGAVYASNGVQDISADGMIRFCQNVSTDFSNIIPGEALWLSGHIGIYIGGGLAVECTPKWKNCVQITAVANIGEVAGYPSRRWTKHGRLPYVEYTEKAKKTVDEIAKEVIAGMWGNGVARKQLLTEAGYDFRAVQDRVNTLMTRPTTTGDFFFDYLKSSGFTDYAAAGIYANLQAESGLKSTNLQNSYEKKLGLNDETYTTAVDSGTYDNFVHDSAGYGLAQWTYWSRKQALLQYARSKGKSIGDKTMQMEFLVREMSKALVTKLNASKSASEAAKIFMLEFEKPGDQSIAAQNKRAQMAEDALKRLL